MGSDGNTTLAECRHDHADDLPDTPPHEDQANDNRNSIDQNFNDGGNRYLSGNGLDNRGESARGNGGTSSQNTSFLKNDGCGKRIRTIITARLKLRATITLSRQCIYLSSKRA